MLQLIAALVTMTVTAQADDHFRPERPTPLFATERVVSGLGPVTYGKDDAGMNRLRVFNSNDRDAVAIVNGSRIEIPAGQIVEHELTGTAIVRSLDELFVTSRSSDETMDNAVNANHDVQVASTDPRRPAIAPLAITTQTCSSTTLVTTSSVACQNGTSSAMVAAIPGATYEWTVVNATILNGQGTNLVTLAFGTVSSASISVVVKTPEGCTLNGAASITVRTPFQIATYRAFPANPTIGDTVIVTWTYTTNEAPRTQKITITAPNGTSTVVNVPLADRSYSFVANATGNWNTSFLGSLIGGRRRSVRSGTSALPAPSACYQGTAALTIPVSDACIPAAGSVHITGSSITQGQTTSVAVSANAQWSLTSPKGNPLSRTSGNGDANLTFTASVLGTDTLTLTIFGECGNITRTDTIVVNAPPMTVKLTADAYTVSFHGTTILHVVVTNPPGPSPTSFSITSSLGNSINQLSTDPGDALTFRYNRNLFLFDDTVTVTVNYSSGSTASDSIVIH